MGDKSILPKKNLNKNDICKYMLSECSDYKESGNTHQYTRSDDLSFESSDQYDLLEEERIAKKKEEDEYFDDLERARQEEWDAQQEYEDRLSEIEDRYPDFDAKETAFWGEDPDDAERKARIDDYLNNWY